MPNEVVYTAEFKKLYEMKGEKSPQYIMKKVKEGLIELRNSDEPERLGVRKKGKLSKYYAYDISRGHRILYCVERKDDKIVVFLHRVRDHKNVYGKD
jgi:mRNA-degrading endonuclease RelE of RelBE toxin-antitoxin system